MEIKLQKTFETEGPCDALLVPCVKNKGLVKAIKPIEKYQKTLESFFNLKDFEANSAEIAVIYSSDQNQKRLIVFGIGEEGECTAEGLRRAFAEALKKALSLKVKRVLTFSFALKDLDERGVSLTLAETAYLVDYEFGRYKKDFQPKQLDLLQILTEADCEQEFASIKQLSLGVNLARDLINQSADESSPRAMADMVKQLAEDHSHLKVTILEKEEIEKENLDLFLAVSRGSDTPPYFAILEYKNNPKQSVVPVLIGKGITYDTGGLSLKPTSGMIDMRSDMGGSGVVLGTMKAIAAQKLPINVTAVCAFCENSIGPNSYKIGDVYRGRSGINVEITNTDAEGRLALADSISYALDKLNPTHLIDLATLTGACEIALGSERSALFSNDDALSKLLFDCGEEVSEKLWAMPIDAEYREILTSKIADIKNSGARQGSLVASAIFLKEFLKGPVKWAHIDIAGTTLLSGQRRYHRTLATGFGVRLLTEAMKRLCS